MEEQWKPIEGYENYEVSNWGRVKSLNYNRTGREHLLSPQKDGKGYFFVNLYKNGERKFFTVHRLVYETFVGEIPEGLQCNHIDEDKENCRLDNINLMTPSQNANWGTRNARVAAAHKGKKKSYVAAALSKSVEAYDDDGNVVFSFPSTMEAGRNGFNSKHISECCRGERKTHKGLHWRYT